LGQIVKDETLTDFLHRDALRFVRLHTVGLYRTIRIETRERASTKLFGAHGGDVHEQESTVYRWSLRARRSGRLGFGRRPNRVVGFHKD
jgi:hypothetical protein